MKKHIWALLIVVALLVLGTAPAYAQSAGAGGGSFSNAYLIPEIVCQAGSFSGTSLDCNSQVSGPKVLYGNIKVPSASNKNLLLMASLETAILTNTQVASKNGNQSTSTAKGSIIVTPTIHPCLTNDCSQVGSALTPAQGVTLYPNKVTFNERIQTLSAQLTGLNCTADLTTGVVTCTDPEIIDLILSTTSAHAFNFMVDGLTSGVYQVQLGVQVSTAATSDSLLAGAKATAAVAAGSLVEMIVQAQTPFTTIKMCDPTNIAPDTVNSCGP